MHDPIGLSTRSTWMTEYLDSTCRNDASLARRLLSRFDIDEETLDYSEMTAAIREKARFEVMADYPDIDKVEGLIDPVFELKQQKETVGLSEGDVSYLYKSLVIHSGVTLEFICKWIVENYRVKRMHDLPDYRDQRYKAEEATSQLLTRSGLKKNQIQDVLQVDLKKLKNAAKGKNSSCRALLAAMFISFADYPHHPMKQLLDKPWLFSDIYKLSHDRDTAAHGELDDDHKLVRFEKRSALNAAKTVDGFLKILFRGLAQRV